MANVSVPGRRFLPAAVLALAVIGAPVVVLMAMPPAAVSTPLAACTGGEEEDVYTTSCVPMLVPNSPDDSGFTTNAANPDIPEIDGVPCTGHDSGACIGLAEDAPQYVPPTSSVDSSPTVTGSTD